MSIGPPMANRDQVFYDKTNAAQDKKPVEPGAAPPVVEESSISRWVPALGVLVVWIVV